LCSVNIDPVVINDNGKDFGVSVIYASTNHIKRRQLWHSLTVVHNSLHLPWSHEHRGAHLPAKVPMEDFLNWSDSNGLIHLPTKGCFDTCSSISVSTLTKNRSDHHPLLFDSQYLNVRYGFNFKFLKMWSYHKDCSTFINNVWSKPVFGSPMQILSQKLKILKGELKIWNKNVFGNIHTTVANSVSKLDKIQQNINLNGYNDSLLQQEKNAKTELEQVLNMEESYWHEKARINWHCQGDCKNQAKFQENFFP
jgi:hypothetical protein